MVAVIAARLTDDDPGSQDTAAWAESVCASFIAWQGEITGLADVEGGELTPESLQDKLDDARSATDELVSDLKGLDRPDVEAGDDVEQALDDAADGLRESATRRCRTPRSRSGRGRRHGVPPGARGPGASVPGAPAAGPGHGCVAPVGVALRRGLGRARAGVRGGEPSCQQLRDED